MKRIAIYSRKSKFTGTGESIENQIELCRRYIRLMPEGDTAEFWVYEDEGFSGGTLERPKFKAMMKDARQGKLSMIIVYRLDRISRNIGDFAGLIEELNRLEIAFVSIKEQFDTSSPMGRAMMYIASVFSQLERETIAERIRDNMLELAKTGRWLGGVTPLGFRSESVSSVTIDGRTKRCCKLQLVEKEAEVVREIYEHYLATGTLVETCEVLNQNSRKTRSGRPFSTPAVRAILCNPVYAAADEITYQYFLAKEVPLFSEKERFDGSSGMIAYNRTLQRPGKTNRIRAINEWIVAVGKHQPIISGGDWTKVQQMLERKRGAVRRGQTGNVSLYRKQDSK